MWVPRTGQLVLATVQFIVCLEKVQHGPPEVHIGVGTILRILQFEYHVCGGMRLYVLHSLHLLEHHSDQVGAFLWIRFTVTSVDLGLRHQTSIHIVHGIHHFHLSVLSLQLGHPVEVHIETDLRIVFVRIYFLLSVVKKCRMFMGI